MKETFGITVAAAVLSALLMITGATYGLIDLVFAQGPPKFTINLTGSEEVPAVQTNAAGTAEISAFDISSDSISYGINATNISGVTAAHTHLGKQGENGPIVATFFKYVGPRPINEVMEGGTITADDLEGPLKGKPLSELAVAGANGSLYINIHTEHYPNGEIRGQIVNPTG
jgi:CHRD domain-containing protein